MTERIEGTDLAAGLKRDVADRVDALDAPPVLATVLMSDDPADRRFVALKHEACEDVGVETRDVRIDADAPAGHCYEAVEGASADRAVDAVFVQAPLPDHVDPAAVRRRVDPAKDVDCFHPANVGRLVAGRPRFVPATPAAVERLLSTNDVTVEGKDVTLVGRSDAIGKPLANRLWGRGPAGNATVTVCHSRTRDLAAKTRGADVVVTAAGEPGLVDGSMLSAGATVVDVSANRVPADTSKGYAVVGDVDFESAREVAGAITPVPGGVGPVTVACLLENVVTAAERRADA